MPRVLASQLPGTPKKGVSVSSPKVLTRLSQGREAIVRGASPRVRLRRPLRGGRPDARELRRYLRRHAGRAGSGQAETRIDPDRGGGTISMLVDALKTREAQRAHVLGEIGTLTGLLRLGTLDWA